MENYDILNIANSNGIRTLLHLQKTITGYGSLIKINACVNAGNDLSFKEFRTP